MIVIIHNNHLYKFIFVRYILELLHTLHVTKTTPGEIQNRLLCSKPVKKRLHVIHCHIFH